jgi:hypothetical protein
LASVAIASVAYLPNAHAEDKKNSVNVSPLGIALGSYSVNYERMLGGGNGVLVEGQFSRSKNSDSSSTGFGGSVGYRYHFNGTQNSWFAGVNAGYQVGTGTGSITSGGTTKSFDVDTTALAVTGNFGKRWALPADLNITFRLGAGYGKYNVTTDSTDPDAQKVVKLVDDLLTFLPVAFDGELSLGYAF